MSLITRDRRVCHVGEALRRGPGARGAAAYLPALVLPALIAILPSTLLSQQVSGRLSSAIYGWEQFDTAGVSENLLHGMQNIQLDVVHGGLTLSGSAYASAFLSGPQGNLAESRVRNAYARWRNDGRTFEASLGRVPVFAGVGVGAVDGALFKLRAMERKLSLTVYGGSNVPGSLVYDHHRDLNLNFLLGAQATAEPVPGTRVGVSYVNRRVAREAYEAVRADSFFNPVTVLVAPGSRATQLVGVDVSHRAEGRFEAYGRYDRDLNLERTRRAELGLRGEAGSGVTLLANLIYREPAIPHNSWFTRFPLAPVRELEGGAEYAFAPALRASLRIAYVGYESDLSRRLTVGVAAPGWGVSYSGSNGSAGELSAFHAYGMVALLEGLLTPTAAAGWTSYRLSATSPDETAFSGALGAVLRPDAPVTVEVQGQWLDNRFLENDLRGLLRVSYWFSHQLGILP